MLNKLRKRKYRDYEINPDEIFLDTINVSGLNTQQFEGVIEKPISRRTLIIISSIVFLILLFFGFRLGQLQVFQGDTFSAYAENNRLRETPVFAERGIIYDKNGTELAWNVQGDVGEPFLYRAYTSKSGHGHLLGYVQYPQVDSSGNYWRTKIKGLAGLESKYNMTLAGKNGAQLYETSALGEVTSKNTITPAESGVNIYTTIDSRIQHELYSAIEKQAQEAGFVGGAGAIMDVHNGSLLAFTSYPEFDPYTLAEGEDVEAIQGFFSDPGKPFLNRVINGLYSPGSIVKPFLGIAALDTGLITENTTILSTGRIEVPNRFNPSNASYFRDWRDGGHGPTNIRHAIADSVNTFFYAIGGGYKQQEGLGISRIEQYVRAFDISEKTGIDFGNEVVGTIPNPEWKTRLFSDGTWRLGDTYNTSIGQFGFQVSPIQMVRAIAALANGGTLYQPLLITADSVATPVSEDISKEHYLVIQEAMRDTVTYGTARIIDVPYLSVAAKTGTAQVGRDNEFYNSWSVGFFPYDDPQYAFTIVMERAPETSNGSASRAMRVFLDSVEKEYPDIWEKINDKNTL